MIPAQLLGLPIDAGNRPAVPSICTVDCLWGDQDHIGGAASMGFLVVLGTVVLIPHFLLDGGDLFAALLAGQQDVHFQEGLAKSLLVFVELVVFVGLEFFEEVTLDKSGHLGAWVKRRVPPCPSKTPKREFLELLIGELLM